MRRDPQSKYNRLHEQARKALQKSPGLYSLLDDEETKYMRLATGIRGVNFSADDIANLLDVPRFHVRIVLTMACEKVIAGRG